LESLDWDAAEGDLEHRLRTWALPLALAGAFLLAAMPFARFLLRVFCGMWVHEIGHAVAAWLCGFPAFPGPWFTPIASERHPLFAAFVILGTAGTGVWFFRAGARSISSAFFGFALLALFCSTALPSARAMQLILFMGDGGCLVLGALLMLSVYAPEASAIRRGWLRWGFLVIGAAAFADVFSLWWGARTNPDLVPFGMNEGRGLSDPSVLSEQFGWSEGALVHRYVVLGCVCLAALAIAWAAALWSGRSATKR
jgi:hypothetical protein